MLQSQGKKLLCTLFIVKNIHQINLLTSAFGNQQHIIVHYKTTKPHTTINL